MGRSNTTALEAGERYQMEFPSFSKGNVIFIVVVDRASRAGLNESFHFSDLFFHLLVHFRVNYYPQLHGNPKILILKEGRGMLIIRLQMGLMSVKSHRVSCKFATFNDIIILLSTYIFYIP